MSEEISIKILGLLQKFMMISVLNFSFIGGNLFAQPHSMQYPKNLATSHFEQKSFLEKKILELIHSTKDAYMASLPLMASALIGNREQYKITLNIMLKYLLALNTKDVNQPHWMQNNGFKAWMWGRILLAAANIGDEPMTRKAQKKLTLLLKSASPENQSFFAWAWAYRGALDRKQYRLSKNKMLEATLQLTEKYKLTKDHNLLSDVLWANVMNLQAAALAGDLKSYRWIKMQIKSASGEVTITHALQRNLLRTQNSNDYPAWAMAKVRYAASVINDKALYDEIAEPLITSIEGAKKDNAAGEFVLSSLENELAVLTSHSQAAP